jgi:DNA-binding transcriptional MerR regulator
MEDQQPLAAAITIGRLAWLAQVSVDTVRFYERSGLLEHEERTSTGYRLYSCDSLARIQFIRRARTIGLCLNQIKSILHIRDQGGSKAEVKEFTTDMLVEVEEKLHGLTKWQELLMNISDYLEHDGTEQIDGKTIDALMRGQCNNAAH